MTTYYEDYEIRLKIDKLLKKNAALESSLGKDSTKKEYGKVKARQNNIFDKIKELDLEFYKLIIIEEDRSN